MAQLSFILHKLINSNKKSRGGACHHEDGEKPSHAVHRGGAAKKEEGLMMAGGCFYAQATKTKMFKKCNLRKGDWRNWHFGQVA